MSSFGQGLDKCIKCSICVEHCPVYRVDSRFPGPKQSGPDSQRFRHDRESRREPWLAACSHCTLCETACPSGVPIATMIMTEQNRQIAKLGKKPVYRILSSPSLLGKIASQMAWLVNTSMGFRITRRIMELMFGIDAHLPFPAYTGKKFTRPAVRSGCDSVLLFHGCTVRYNQPQLGTIIMDLLDRLDCRVIVPEQDCCGLPKLCNADERGAAKLAAKQVAEFSRKEWQSMPIIFTCTSCGHTLAHEWGHVLDHSTEFSLFADRLYDVHEFIAEQMRLKSRKLPWKRRPAKIAYHIPCHLRSLGIGYPAVQMIRSIPALDVHVLNTGCCGLSGTYGYKPGHGDVSRKIGNEVAHAIHRLKPDYIMTDCGSCRLQLESLTGIPARDPLEIIADSLAT